MKTSLPLLILLIAAPLLSLAQGWERKYSTTIDHKGIYAHPTTDGGYIFAASSTNAIYAFYNDPKVIKTNANGDTIWTRSFNDINIRKGRPIQQTSDGGYILASTNKNGGLINLIKFTPTGAIEWRKDVASPWSTVNMALMSAYSIQQTSDGGFIMAGEFSYVGAGTSDAILIKTNSTGVLTWGRSWQYAWLRTNWANAVEQTADGGYVLAGYGEAGGFVIKTDVNGYATWEKSLGDFDFSDLRTANNEPGYVLIASRIRPAASRGAYFVKLKDNGDTLFTKRLGAVDTVFLKSIDKTSDGGFCIGGYTRAGNIPNNVLLIKTNKDGDTSWTRTFGDAYEDLGYSARQTEDGNYIIGGTSTDAAGKTQAYLIRTDKLGNVLTNLITGNIFEDRNNNCAPDANERPLTNPAYWKVKVMPGDKYATPDASGYYSVKVDTGRYDVSLINTHPYWEQTCPTPAWYPVSFNEFYDSVFNQNFGLKLTTNCPLMSVDVATSIVRACRPVTHTIRYCNDGSVDAQNVYLEFTLDAALTFDGSTPAVTSVDGKMLRFNIGTVPVGQCGTIYVTTTAACSLLRDNTVCVKANIYPDSICSPVPFGWDKSSIRVTGKCIGNGKARFVIQNSGNDMQGPSQYRIFVDNALVQTNSFQLRGDRDSLVIQMDACGRTVRLEADQLPGHPGNSHPRATVEGCVGCAPQGPASLTMRTAVPEDDEDEAVEIDCAIVRASFDPNEKLVMPTGTTGSHYVAPNTELEYRINFQNTGNDTAFLVVLRDTIDLNVLDITSLKPGVSSHPNTFKITDKGALEWRFENILLPDSTTNERASHGFVKFKIKQIRDLPDNTTISNRASIYFDFNAPVVTDPAELIVNRFVPTNTGNYNIIIIDGNNPGGTGGSTVTVVPHPLETSSILRVTSTEVSASDVLTMTIYDAANMKLRTGAFTGLQTELKREWFVASGVYFCEIRKGSKRVAVVKLLVR